MLAVLVGQAEAVSAEAFGWVADLSDGTVLALQLLVLLVGQLRADFRVAQQTVLLGLNTGRGWAVAFEWRDARRGGTFFDLPDLAVGWNSDHNLSARDTPVDQVGDLEVDVQLRVAVARGVQRSRVVHFLLVPLSRLHIKCRDGDPVEIIDGRWDVEVER